MTIPAVVLVSILLQGAAQLPPAQGAETRGYVPERVYDTGRGAFADFEVMLADLARADVVLVGEQHGDPNTHRLEAAILDGLLRREASPVVSLEMFERDVQPAIDAYLTGHVSEEATLKAVRPWPRYATDYRGLVERARAQGWPVIASNVPRRIAQAVAKGGRAALDELGPEDRTYVAADLRCPFDDVYFDRFAKTMGSHPGANESPEEQRAALERYYWSQCVKDETMAESIAAAVADRSESRRPVVHYTGAFHSDFRLGTAARVVRRLPDSRVVVISILPVEDLDAIDLSAEDLQRADYLVFTTR